MGKIGLFLAAMLYGVSWIAAAINFIAIVAGLSEGQEVAGYLPVLLASLGVVLYVHYLSGWPPFLRRRQPDRNSGNRGGDR